MEALRSVQPLSWKWEKLLFSFYFGQMPRKKAKQSVEGLIVVSSVLGNGFLLMKTIFLKDRKYLGMLGHTLLFYSVFQRQKGDLMRRNFKGFTKNAQLRQILLTSQNQIYFFHLK